MSNSDAATVAIAQRKTWASRRYKAGEELASCALCRGAAVHRWRDDNARRRHATPE